MCKTSYHVHTRHCMHASGRDEEYVIGTIKNGYEEIGFSDHSPWNHDSDFVANMQMSLLKFDDYYTSASSLGERYRNCTPIKIGLEYEYSPKYIDWLKQFLIDKKLDYIVSGNRYFKTNKGCMYFGTTCGEEVQPVTYVDGATTGMKTNLCSYLCHSDLFMQGRRVFDEVAECESMRLCQAAKELHIPLEYNLASTAYSDITHTAQYPRIDFRKTATEVGDTAIVGADAHEPAALKADSYREKGIAPPSGLGMKTTDALPLKDLISYERRTYIDCGG